MTQVGQQKGSGQQGFPALKKLPIFGVVSQLHNRNMKVAKVCRQHSLNSLHSYYTNKSQYFQVKDAHHNQRVKAAMELQQNKRKMIECRNKDEKKKNSDNIQKLENFFMKRRVMLQEKQNKMMEGSSLRRQNYLQSLNSSYHRSQDKRYHLKQREQKELQRSILLMHENNKKVEVAIHRKECFINELRQALRQKNEQITNIQQFSKDREIEKQKEFLQSYIQKMEDARKSQEERIIELNRQIQNKKKENSKNKEKHDKKRCDLQQMKQKKREDQNMKIDLKIQKANQMRRSYLEGMTNNINTKRQIKEKEQFFCTQYTGKEVEKKISEINRKHYQSQQQFYQFKKQKEQIRNQNMYDYCSSNLKL